MSDILTVTEHFIYLMIPSSSLSGRRVSWSRTMEDPGGRTEHQVKANQNSDTERGHSVFRSYAEEDRSSGDSNLK